MMGRYRHTVTQIVASVYCEQKVVFDRRHGKATPRELQVKAASGAFEHLRFQWEGYTRNPGRRLVKIAEGRQATDSRCFIASQVYGADAPETNALRAWRRQDSDAKQNRTSDRHNILLAVADCCTDIAAQCAADEHR